MKRTVLLTLAALLLAPLAGLAIGLGSVSAAKKPEPTIIVLTKDGEKFQARYADMLTALQAEITKALPVVVAQKKSALHKAREATKVAEKAADAAQQSLGKVQEANGLVEHAKGKWIGGAEKGIAQAQAALKKATTDAQREAAKKELAKWQANKEEGTVQEGQKFKVLAIDGKGQAEIAVPYTCGLWQQTKPVELPLVSGKNVLHFSVQDGSRGVTIKDFTLIPVK